MGEASEKEKQRNGIICVLCCMMNVNRLTQGTFHYMTMGCLSKVIASVTTYPYQVVKSRLQVSTRHPLLSSSLTHLIPIPIQQQKPCPYKGVLECIYVTWKGEGVKGFYGGLVPNVLKVLPAAAITFVAYENIAKAFQKE